MSCCYILAGILIGSGLVRGHYSRMLPGQLPGPLRHTPKTVLVCVCVCVYLTGDEV